MPLFERFCSFVFVPRCFARYCQLQEGANKASCLILRFAEAMGRSVLFQVSDPIVRLGIGVDAAGQLLNDKPVRRRTRRFVIVIARSSRARAHMCLILVSRAS
jgi:hypothetical protein